MADQIPEKARDGSKNFVIKSVGAVSRPVVTEPPKSELPPGTLMKMASELSLDELEAQLRASLAEVSQKKRELAEAKKREEELQRLNRQVVLTVVDFAGAYIIVKGDVRDDVLRIWQQTTGRAYRGDGSNAIPVAEWDKTLAALRSLPEVEIVFAKGVEDNIHHHLHAPTWDISIGNKVLKLVPGPRANSWDLNSIPGFEYKGPPAGQNGQRWWSAPLSEAWRVYTALEEVEGVMWSEEAKEFTIRQLETRASMDKIGKAETWDYPAEFINGFKLRPFQGVAPAFAEAAGGRALWAYEMGLGKTPMSIAYAIKNKFRTVVVCPASLKSNWCRQIEKFTGQRPYVLFGAEPSKYDLIQMLTSPSQFTVINYDILGRNVKYENKRVDEAGFEHVEHKVKFMWVDVINMSKPDLVIFDESHYIKNTDANRSVAALLVQAPSVLHMTGTPILNRPGELWPILHHLQPASFPSEQIFINQYSDGKKAKNVEQLKEAIKSVMIRRRQADVEKQLPPKERILEYHELSDKAKVLYKKVMQGVYEKIAEYDSKGIGGDKQAVANILVQIMRLKQICAIDKVERTADLATEIHLSHEESRHNKVLIFTQFKPSAVAIARRLGHECLSFVHVGKSDFVTANNIEQDRLVQQFQNDPKMKYLVATEKTAKEGHDITEAGFVIFNDLFWTPANHDQCEGRAYMRVSDPHGIQAYYMITDSEKAGYDIEEWIWELLGLKTEIISSTVDAVEATRDESVAMALINRMREAMWTRKK